MLKREPREDDDVFLQRISLLRAEVTLLKYYYTYYSVGSMKIENRSIFIILCYIIRFGWMRCIF